MASDNAVDYMIRSTDFAAFQSLVPAMTSNTTPEGECFANNEYSSNYQAWEAFDGIDEAEDRWATSSYTPAYIGYRFINPKCVKKFKLKCVCASSVTYTYQLQGSNDGSIYYNIGSTVTTTHSSSAQYVEAEKEVSNNNDYVYYRVYITSNVSNNVSLMTLEFYSASIVDSEAAMQYIGASDYASNQVLTNTTWREAIGNSNYVESVLNVKVPNMTSATTPSGEVFTDAATSGSAAYCFFDGNVSQHAGWNQNSYPHWIGYDFERAVSIYGFKWYAYSAYGGKTIPMKLEYSDDKSTWDSYTDTVNAAQAVAWSAMSIHPVTTAHRYWRIYCATQGTAGSIAFGELQYYGRENGGVQTWLALAGLEKNYYTLAQVLADTTTLTALMNNTAAVDYLVTVRSWINDITANEAAMTAIGNSNYASNTLLTDSNWCSAICNSVYFESVLNVKVPTMTSNTTPSGIASATLETSGAAWQAFDGNLGTYWGTSSTTTGTVYYEFVNNVTIFLMTYAGYGSGYGANSVSLVDGNNTVIKTQSMQNITGAQKVYIGPNNYSAKKYGCKINSTFANTQASAMEVQFYGRQDV